MAESFTTRLIQRLQIEQKKNDHGGVFEDIANGYPIREYKNRRNIVSICTDWQSFMQIMRLSTRSRTETDEPDG